MSQARKSYTIKGVERRAVSLEVDGLKIVGEIYIPEDPEGRLYPALCICHGIPRGIPDPKDKGYPLLAERFCNAGFITMIFNFRGTGDSEGNFDLLGWARDLEAAVNYLYNLPNVDKSHLSLMGFSGGAIVSLFVAARDPRVSSIVTCACPLEFPALTDKERAKSFIEHLRSIGIIRDNDFPRSLDEWLDEFKQVSPIKWVGKISPRPILILHGDRDEVVDQSQAWALYALAGEPKDIVIIEGATHRLRHYEKAIDAALNWLKSRFGLI